MLRFGRFTLLAGLALLTGCVQRTLIFEKSLPLPDGRFAGPVAVELPRRAEHKNHDFEIHLTLRSACDPLLKVSFPDGETATLGGEDAVWQSLLARRAAAGADADRPPGSPPPGLPGAPPPPAGPGHWQPVFTESWAGQLTFLAQRSARCSSVSEHAIEYLNALDESGKLTFWADPPQEIAGGKLGIAVYEVMEDEEIAAASTGGKVSAHVSAGAAVSVEIPPMPPPRKETPAPAEDPGATWISGQWVWSPGQGRWVWVHGYWQAPAQEPALRNEDTGPPPNPGCTWAHGHWTWVHQEGKWEWHPGHWNPPPPRQESPGTPQVPDQPWIAGYWVKVQGHFEWVPGHWGKPNPRAETPPPSPVPGARWVAGVWIFTGGKWVWSPGYWDVSGRPPPAAKAETPPPSPGRGAVWLGGFWRWSASKSDYEWIPGHWELPPGEGYVWVADPPGPAGVSIGGRWVLKVDVKVDTNVKVKP